MSGMMNATCKPAMRPECAWSSCVMATWVAAGHRKNGAPICWSILQRNSPRYCFVDGKRDLLNLSLPLILMRKSRILVAWGRPGFDVGCKAVQCMPRPSYLVNTAGQRIVANDER